MGKRDALHVRAQVAGPHELDLRVESRHVVAHRALGHEGHTGRALLADEVGHPGGRSGKVGCRHHLRRRLRVGQHHHVRIALAHLTDVLGGEALVHLAVPGPGDDLNLRHQGCRVLRQELVRQHDHTINPERLDDFLGIARGAADVRLGLHGRGCVDIGDHRNTRVARPQLTHILCRDRLREGTAGLIIWNEHRFVWIEEFGGLGHEVHAGQHDDVSIGVHRLTRQRQAVADDVGHRVEDLGCLVVVGQNDRVVLRA